MGCFNKANIQGTNLKSIKFHGDIKIMNISAQFKADTKEIWLRDMGRKTGRNMDLVIKFTDNSIFASWKKALTLARKTRWPDLAKKNVIALRINAAA